MSSLQRHAVAVALHKLGLHPAVAVARDVGPAGILVAAAVGSPAAVVGIAADIQERSYQHRPSG